MTHIPDFTESAYSMIPGPTKLKMINHIKEDLVKYRGVMLSNVLGIL